MKSNKKGNNLDANIKEVMSSAKQKITLLNEEIASLTKEGEVLTQKLQQTEEQKKEQLSINQQLLDEISKVNTSIASLQEENRELQNQLKEERSSMAKLIDDAEKQQRELKLQIKRLSEEDKKLKDQEEKEKTNYEQQIQREKARLERLKEALNAKEYEIDNLKKEIDAFNKKDEMRVANLENEEKELKSISNLN